MNLRHIGIPVIIFVGLLILSIVVYYQTIKPQSLGAEMQTTETPARAALAYPAAYNFRQSVNDCGPYAAAAAIRIVTVAPIDSQQLVKELPIRLPNGGTLPRSLEVALKNHGLTARAENFADSELTDDERLQQLSLYLSQGHPVILLGEKTGVQHYITLVGYEKKNATIYFDVYDSWHTKGAGGLTTDDNDAAPGNRTLRADELLEFWRSGGLFGLYKYYALVVSH